MRGFRFYSSSGEILLEMGNCSVTPTEFALEEGERVLGIKSRLSSKEKNPYHCDLQFVIGKMV